MTPKMEGTSASNLLRLPKTVIPKRYELKLDVYPQKKRYEGQVNIRLYFYAKETHVIWLHSVKLKIAQASMRFSQFTLPVEAEEIIHKPYEQCIGIRFACAIAEGTRSWLSIHFSGKISPHLEGFFSTPYVDRNGEKHLGAATMFAGNYDSVRLASN